LRVERGSALIAYDVVPGIFGAATGAYSTLAAGASEHIEQVDTRIEPVAIFGRGPIKAVLSVPGHVQQMGGADAARKIGSGTRSKQVSSVPDNLARIGKWMARSGVDLVAALDEGNETVTADEAGGSGYKQALHGTKSE